MKMQKIKRTILILIFAFSLGLPVMFIKNLTEVKALPVTPPVTAPVTPTPTPGKEYFQFLVLKNPVYVNEKFFINWVWTTLGNPAAYVQFTATIPSGVYLNWNDECRSGNGCVVSYTLFNSGSAGSTVVSDAKGLRPGKFLLSTEYWESNGKHGIIPLELTVLDYPTNTPTPTSTPTPTPTAKPTVTPTPTPTSTPTPTVKPTVTPTPTIKLNHNPVILTSNLPKGKVGKWYVAFIRGRDVDNDKLWGKIVNLPKEFKSACDGERGNKVCTIWGFPLKKGISEIRVTIWDQFGGSTIKNFKLEISGK